MNEAPESQVTGMNDTFSSQSAPATNPFTADLKGEFTSNFGTNTNAVSQIFKEGGFVNQSRAKYLMIGGAVLVVLVVGFMLMTGGEEDEFASEETADELGEGEEGAETEDFAEEGEEGTEGEEGMEASGEEGEYAEESGTAAEATESAGGEYASGASGSYASAGSYSSGASMSGAITLTEPADGSTISYDETQGSATFSWSGGGGYIIFSRNPTMTPEITRSAVSGNSHTFHHPWPGTWYWKVENSSGSTEVRSFTVNTPVRRNVQVAEPAAGGAVAGTGGTVSWQGDSSVAFYRVELSQGSWANPSHRFATSGNSVQLQGVGPGQYNMRVGAFSEVSGRWEYTAAQPVSVQ